MDDDDRRHGNTQDSGVWNRSIWMMMTGDTGTRKTVRCVEQAYMDDDDRRHGNTQDSEVRGTGLHG